MMTRKELTQKAALPIGEEETLIFPEFVCSTGYSYAATWLRSYGKTVSTVGDNKTYMYRSTTQKSKRGGAQQMCILVGLREKPCSKEQVNEAQKSK